MKLTTMLVAVLIPLSAVAQTPQAPPPAPKPLTVGQCMEILGGLTGLNSYDKVVGDKIVPAQYKLGAARFTIVQNMTALRHVQEGLERARAGLVAEVASLIKGGDIKPNSPELTKLTVAYQAMLDKPCDVTPGRIKRADLNIGDGPEQNAIPPSVESALDLVLDK